MVPPRPNTRVRFLFLYSYAEHLGFDVEVVKYDTVSPTGAKGSSKLLSDTGIQEAAAAIRGRGVFRALKYECGVHRVQRVPVTGGFGELREGGGEQVSSFSLAVW